MWHFVLSKNLGCFNKDLEQIENYSENILLKFDFKVSRILQLFHWWKVDEDKSSFIFRCYKV